MTEDATGEAFGRAAERKGSGSPIGDVLRAWHRLQPQDPETRARIAAALGVHWSPPVEVQPPAPQPQIPEPIGPPALEEAAQLETPSGPQRSFDLYTSAPVSDTSTAGEILGETAMEIYRELLPFPAKEPLLNPQWTRGIFSTRLSQAVASRTVDIDAIIRSEFQARPLDRLPWKRVFTMSSGVRCFIDISAPFDIFIEDRAQVLRALRAIAGFERVSVTFFETLPDGTEARAEPGTEGAAAPEAPILLLTDFGHYSVFGRHWALHEEWLAWVERERARGTTRIVALTPLEAAQWPAVLLSEMEIVLWDWQTGVGKRRLHAR